MDDSRLPWWLIVLLAIGVIGIAIWQSSRATPPIRWGAMGLGLTYLALLAFTIGGDPRGVIGLHGWGTPQYLLAGLNGLSILAAVLLIGCAEARGQTVWFGALSAINAGTCASQSAPAVALLLTLISLSCLGYIVAEARRGQPFQAADLFPQRQASATERPSGAIWLAAGTGLILSMLLVGTIHQALRAESTRATATRRLSALPAQSRIRSLLDLPAKSSPHDDALTIAFDRRADVMVLLSVLAFVSMAAVFARRPPPQDAHEPSSVS